MTVSCPECRSVFRVDPSKVPATGVRARCSVCGGVIAISAGTLPISVTPASSGIVQQGFSSGSGVAQRGAPTPQRPFTPPLAPRSVAPTPVSPPAMPTPAAPPAVAPAVMTPPIPSSLAGDRPERSVGSPLTAAPASPASATVMPAGMPAATPSAGTATAGTTATGTPSTGRRPINPFLNADPGQRARRLARALVSDLVAYHPQKREEGLKDGTLRQRFRDEIKKSYEEYVEQVGRELADGTPHFQDALNEILGGGRKLF